jgi:selenocysteine lyase/cysteine desulfurase
MIAAPLPPETDLVALKANLYDEYNVEVPLVDHSSGKYVRVSIQGYTTRQEIDTFIRGLAVLL